MKRVCVMVLTIGLVISMVTAALAVEYSYSMGGRFYSYASTIEGDKGFNPSPGVDCWDTILGATVREGNTWASIKFIADSWNQKIYHSFGIDNIGGSPLSIGFDSHDTGTANLGQQFIGDLFNDFKADPYFNTCDMAGSVFSKYITDSFEVRAEAQVYDGDGDTDNRVDYDSLGNPIADQFREAYALGIIFKPEWGKVYFGGKHISGRDDSLIILGAEFNISNIGIKLDYWDDQSGLSNQGQFSKAFWNYGGHQTFQGTVSINKFTGQLMYSKPVEALDDVVGIGGAYQINRWTVGAKYFKVDEDVSSNNFYDVYGMYKVGAWDLKIGTSNAQFPFGNKAGYNAGGGYNDDQAVENKDGFFYAGVHFEF
jgi:hypothetical protein